MKKTRTFFFCQNCGHQSPKWLGKCPACEMWHQFTEEVEGPPASVLSLSGEGGSKVTSITEITAEDTSRLPTGIGEMDRVLGGGLVRGSAVLVGGEPGIGKSTLLLQILDGMARRGMKVLYISGEESLLQIKMRGERIGTLSENLFVLVEIDLDSMITRIEAAEPAVVVIDSIQTVVSSTTPAAIGSVAQIREAAGRLVVLAKKRGIPVFLIGHVTKEGVIAGPKLLEHMVDTVLYFEGDSGHQYRIVRAMKNRFGPVSEIGVFEMKEGGLAEVGNPSTFFLSTRPEQAPGSVVCATLEGTRCFLVEIQSLVMPTAFGLPRRTVNGVDHNRVSLLVAVLDKICGYQITNCDIYLNVVGGMKIAEPAVDLGIAASLISAFLERPVADGLMVFGEVGLSGEVRGTSQPDLRVREAARMGFMSCLAPSGTGGGETGRIKVTPLDSLKRLRAHIF